MHVLSLEVKEAEREGHSMLVRFIMPKKAAEIPSASVTVTFAG